MLLPAVYSGPRQVTSDMQVAWARGRLTRAAGPAGAQTSPQRKCRPVRTGPATGHAWCWQARDPGPGGKGWVKSGAPGVQCVPHQPGGAPVLNVMAVGGVV